MKILYGVQGTGNGHITRARIMAKALAAAGAQVDWVFSGRSAEAYFDMDIFPDYRTFRGLTFALKGGRVSYVKSALNSNLAQLYRDINHLNVEGYDFILNDFEPVSAWAARRAGKKVIGISHQNAFRYDIPKRGSNIFVEQFMRYFAPASLAIGLHWHHFNQPLLPPIIEPSSFAVTHTPHLYLVYLPFADLDDILPQLRQFSDYEFLVYRPVLSARREGHIHILPFSRTNFQTDLHRCEGVICSAGFELPSETIQLGKKLLVQPVGGQMEQQSNGLALQQLGYAHVTEVLSTAVIDAWFKAPSPPAVHYPNVAEALVKWLITANGNNLDALVQQLWQEQSAANPVTPRHPLTN
jgi:uncharacterized protein (TIGR00661 family)